MPDCAFCGRPENEVKKLVGREGGALICDRCVVGAAEALGREVLEDKEEDKPIPNPREIQAHLDKYIIGQESARQDISVAIYKHYRRREAAAQNLLLGTDLEDVEIQKSNILLLGPSGTGKTEIARTVSRFLGLPFYVADATKMTQSGYVGEDVETCLQGLVSDASGDIERAQWGIVVIDEIDKLCRKTGRGATGYRDVSGEGVQQALLRLVEGGIVMVPRQFSKIVASMGDSDPVDTTNILFICMGSFASGLDEVVAKRVNKDVAIGFGAKARKKDLDLTEVYQLAEEEDVLEMGLIPELAGRLPVLTSTLPLTEDEMVRILTEPRNAIAKQFRAQFAMDRIRLTFEDEAYREMAQMAMKGETGARALRRIMERVLKPYVFKYAGSTPTIEAIHITEAVVKDGAEAVITRPKEVATG
jgi:ATP-dependent Clp protease ATP-binding subunit ClpX